MWAFLFSVFKIIFKLCKYLLNAFEKWPHIQYQIAVRPRFPDILSRHIQSRQNLRKRRAYFTNPEFLQKWIFQRTEDLGFQYHLGVAGSLWLAAGPPACLWETQCWNKTIFVLLVYSSLSVGEYFMVDWLFYYLKCVLQINLICPVT